MKYISKQRGITLIETVVAVAIFAIFVVAASTFLLFIFTGQKETARAQELAFQTNKILTAFREQVQVANGIIAPSKGGSAAAATLEISSASDVTFFMSDSNLFLGEDGGQAQQINTNGIVVEDVTFTNLSFDEIEVLRIAVRVYHEEDVSTAETFYTSILVP